MNKKIIVKAEEIKKFWNILCRNRGIFSVFFKNNRAIFTSSGHSVLVSYSSPCEGPQETRCFKFFPFRIKGETGDLNFEFYGQSHNVTGNAVFQQNQDAFTLFPQDQPIFGDISDEGVDAPVDMPKTLKRLMKVRINTQDVFYENIYFVKLPDRSGGVAITDGNSLMWASFPVIPHEGEISVPILSMSSLPGGGLFSIISMEGMKRLCYQCGDWLLSSRISTPLMSTGFDASGLFSLPSPISAKIRINEGDFKNMFDMLDGLPLGQRKGKVPYFFIKTTTLNGVKTIKTFLKFKNRFNSCEPIGVVSLLKTEWITNNYYEEFFFGVRDMKNALSAKFTEFCVSKVDPRVTMIKSENNGFHFISCCSDPQ